MPLSLAVHDRAALAEKLLASLEELSEEEAERLWAEEAQRRREEYRAAAPRESRRKRYTTGRKDSSSNIPVIRSAREGRFIRGDRQ